MSYLGDNYFFSSDSTRANDGLVKVDLTTGSVIKLISMEGSGFWNSEQYLQMLYRNNYLWIFYDYGSTEGVWQINEDESLVTQVVAGLENQGLSGSRYVVGMTADKKYAILTSSSPLNGNIAKTLSIIEFISDTSIRVLGTNELPIDLQPYAESSEFSVTFNPNTGILTLAKYGTAEYAIFKYENETWTKLTVNIPITEEQSPYSLTFSADMNKVCIGHRVKNYGTIYNLNSFQGYMATPYDPRLISEKTTTGIAAGAVQPDQEFTAFIAGSANV